MSFHFYIPPGVKGKSSDQQVTSPYKCVGSRKKNLSHSDKSQMVDTNCVRAKNDIQRSCGVHALTS